MMPVHIRQTRITTLLGKLTSEVPQAKPEMKTPTEKVGEVKTVTSIDDIAEPGDYRINGYIIRVIVSRTSLFGEMYSAQVWSSNHRLEAEIFGETLDEVKKKLKQLLQK